MFFTLGFLRFDVEMEGKGIQTTTTQMYRRIVPSS